MCDWVPSSHPPSRPPAHPSALRENSSMIASARPPARPPAGAWHPVRRAATLCNMLLPFRGFALASGTVECD